MRLFYRFVFHGRFPRITIWRPAYWTPISDARKAQLSKVYRDRDRPDVAIKRDDPDKVVRKETPISGKAGEWNLVGPTDVPGRPKVLTRRLRGPKELSVERLNAPRTLFGPSRLDWAELNSTQLHLSRTNS